nr:hypothetical protein [Nanoarchaeum sp.]
MKKLIEKIRQDKLNYIVIAVALVYFLSAIFYISKLKQLPSPLLGGDLYYQLGSINHIIHGGGIFAGSNVLGSLPVYLPIYSLVIVLFSLLTGLDTIKSMLISSTFLSLISFLVLFFVSYKLFKNKLFALIAASLILIIKEAVILKYTALATYILFPILFLALYYTIKEKKKSYAIITGVIYGICSLSHGVAFIVGSIFIGLTYLYFIYIHRKEKDEIKLLTNIFLILIIIGVLIAQLYWFKPIFVYHGQTSENYLNWNNQDFSSFDVQKDFFLGKLKFIFFYFANVQSAIASILCIIGIISVFMIKTKNTLKHYIDIFLITSLVLLLHHFVTRPLIGMDLYPVRIADFLIPIIQIILICLGLTYISKKTKLFHKNIVPVILLIVILVFNVASFNSYIKNDKWALQGQVELPSNALALEDYVTQNTEVNDVFISTNELNFLVNALTGRKVLNSRLAHNDPFLEMEPRMKAAAIILYSNNEELRQQYLEEYDIKYLYWDISWISTDYILDEQGRIINRYDPIVLFDTVENREFLTSNNIEFFPQNTWVDPALNGDEYKKFDLLFVLPTRKDFLQPWDASLDSHLEEVWKYDENNMTISRVYLIK